MSRHTFLFTPLDTWFFRDGRPFDIGPLHTSVVSQFPPPPRTLIGALRFALARGRGYSGRGSWSAETAEVLGDGPHDMGKLRFGGAFVLSDGEPVYPMPLLVRGTRIQDAAGRPGFRPETLLAPGAPVLCDLGEARLPSPVHRDTGLQTGSSFFLKTRGMDAVLAGAVPAAADVVSSESLFTLESRVGLARDDRKHTANDGELYTATHVRLKEGVSLALEVEGIPDDWVRTCPRVIGLGGESRMAELDVAAPLPQLRTPETTGAASNRVTVLLLTPLHLGGETMPRPRQEIPGLPGVRVVSACLGKPVLWGGWNSLERAPLPLSPYLPAGSAWFCTVDAGDAERLRARHWTCLGKDAALGLGVVALGTWGDLSNA